MRRLLLALDVVLVGVAAVLGLELYRTWTAPETPVSSPAPAAGPAEPDVETKAPAAARPALAVFDVVAERNLFNPNRVEAPPEAVKPGTRAAAAPAPAKPRLYGIVLLPDGKARAYLEDAQRKRVFAFSVGDSIADSRVEQIKDDRVVLRRGGEVYEVLLRDPSKPKPPPAQAATNPFAAAAAALRGQGRAAEGQVAPAVPTPPVPAAGPFRGLGRPTPAPAVPRPGLLGGTPPGLANPFAPLLGGRPAPPAAAPGGPEAGQEDGDEDASQ